MNIKICDRCHKEIGAISFAEFKEDEAWRYMIKKDCHPYSEEVEIDLCLDCKKELVKWLEGVEQ